MSPEPPLVRELSPAPDPWDAFERLGPLAGRIFLDSALRRPELGRYSYITADPFERFRIGALGGGPVAADPFAALQARLGELRSSPAPGLPPFQGGAAGLLGYGLGRHLESIPPPRRDDLEIPDLAVGLYDWVLAFDHLERRAWLISQGLPEAELGARRRRAQERLEMVLGRLAGERPHAGPAAAPEQEEDALDLGRDRFPVEGLPGLLSNFSRAAYLDAVARAVEYVRAGDIFQVNLSQLLLYPRRLTDAELFRRLRERNPAPFSAYFAPAGERFAIASASPERFLRVGPDGGVETRPIKGTRPRRPLPEEDCFARDELRESGKDRSENVMIVDLLRNDLSRVCQAGSIQVPRLFGVETYPSVHHLVSVVRGRLRQGLGPLDLLRAAFPGGSITGAPKIRAMEIIAELEPDARGAYCGSLAWIGFDGAMDASILIRTVTAARGWFSFPAGGGIVAASDPEREYQETIDKARGILWALV